MSTTDFAAVAETWPRLSGTVRVPHSNEELAELVSLLDQLTDEVGEDESHPLASLMDVVGVLVEKYEDEHIEELS